MLDLFKIKKLCAILLLWTMIFCSAGFPVSQLMLQCTGHFFFSFFFPPQKDVFSRVICSNSLLQNVKNSAWGFGECRHSYSRWRHATHSGLFGIFNPFLSVQSQQHGTRCAEYKCVVFSIGKGLRRSRSKCKKQSFNLSFGVCDSPAASKYGNRWIDLFFFFFYMILQIGSMEM